MFTKNKNVFAVMNLQNLFWRLIKTREQDGGYIIYCFQITHARMVS